MKTQLFIVLAFLWSTNESNAQFITNPSFEGTTGAGLIPEGWEGCDENSTPDTQPGFWEVNNSPSHGESYLGLITRGNLGGSANIPEDISTSLTQPLQIGSCYSMSLDLAKSSDFGHTYSFGQNWLSYDSAIVVEVWGSSILCLKEQLLWSSPPIDHEEWIEYSFTIQPLAAEIDHILFQAKYVTLPEYFGNALIDNIQLTDLSASVLQLDTTIFIGTELQLEASVSDNYSWSPSDGLSCSNCSNPFLTVSGSGVYQVLITSEDGCQHEELFIITVAIEIPNIFSPNDDGVNDRFVINGLGKDTHLTIYNRWGQIIFLSKNYSNDWSGRSPSGVAATEGVYFYVIENEQLFEPIKGTLQLVR